MPSLPRLLSNGAVFLLVACAQTPARNTAPIPATATATATVRDEIAATLAHGARAWNAGNLDDFLSDYLPSGSTSFVTNRGVLHGLDAIRGVYAARFAAGAQRDSLHFENLEVDLLTPDVVNAIAFYVLMRRDSVTSRGPTSLLMRRVDGRWRIVHDHSS